MRTLHVASDQLQSRYPYPEPTHFDFTEPTVGFGRKNVMKTADVLRILLEKGADDIPQDSEVKRANVTMLLEPLLDTMVVGDTTINANIEILIPLLKDLLSDADPVVRKRSADVLARMSSLHQGRQSICEAGCVDALATFLEDQESADVRIAAGRALLALTQSVDGRESIVGDQPPADRNVITRIVTALLRAAERSGPVATPELVEPLLEVLANLLQTDECIQLALDSNLVPFLVHTLRRRNHPTPAMKCLVSVCGSPAGKRAAIEGGMLAALCGLLASKDAGERRLAARSVLLIAADEEGKRKSIVLVPNLVQQLYEEDHDMYMNALLAVRSVSEWPATREMVMRVLEDDPEMRSRVLSDHQIHLAAFRYEKDRPDRV